MSTQSYQLDVFVFTCLCPRLKFEFGWFRLEHLDPNSMSELLFQHLGWYQAEELRHIGEPGIERHVKCLPTALQANWQTSHRLRSPWLIESCLYSLRSSVLCNFIHTTQHLSILLIGCSYRIVFTALGRRGTPFPDWLIAVPTAWGPQAWVLRAPSPSSSISRESSRVAQCKSRRSFEFWPL